MYRTRALQRSSDGRLCLLTIISMFAVSCGSYNAVHISEIGTLPTSSIAIPWDTAGVVQFQVWASTTNTAVQRGRVSSGIRTDQNGVFQVDTNVNFGSTSYTKRTGNDYALPNAEWIFPQYQVGFGLHSQLVQGLGLGAQFDLANASTEWNSGVTGLLTFQDVGEQLTLRINTGLFWRMRSASAVHVRITRPIFVGSSATDYVEFEHVGGRSTSWGVVADLGLSGSPFADGPDLLLGGSLYYHRFLFRETLIQLSALAGVRVSLAPHIGIVAALRTLSNASLSNASPAVILIPQLQLDIAP